jgi:hypothetical protein
MIVRYFSAVVLAATSILPSLFAAAAADTPAVPVPIKVLRYAEHLLEKYDLDKDGMLHSQEWSSMQGNPMAADANGDGLIDRQELSLHIARYGQHRRIRLTPGVVDLLEFRSLLNPEVTSGAGIGLAPEPTSAAMPAGSRRFVPAGSRLPPGLPAWFSQRDRDGDGQLSLAEFIADGAEFAEFAAYDRNGDGRLTAAECVRGPADAPEPTPEPVSPVETPGESETPDEAEPEPDPEAAE